MSLRAQARRAIGAVVTTCVLLGGTVGLAAPARAADAPTNLYFWPEGSKLGGNKAINVEVPFEPALRLNGVVPTTDPVQPFTVIATTGNTSATGYTLNASIAARVSGTGTSADDAVLQVTQPTDSLPGSIQLNNPNPVGGDAFKVTVTIPGTALSATSWLLYERPSPDLFATPTATNTALGSSFTSARGSVVLSPQAQTTAGKSNNQVIARAYDQFGNGVAGKFVFAVSGRNTASKTVTSQQQFPEAALLYTDTGSATQESVLSDPSTFDTIAAYYDSDGDGAFDNGVETGSFGGHYYTNGAPAVVALDGGIGTPIEQFASTSPYASVTSDDTKTLPFDDGDFFKRVPVDVYFQVRSANNRRLPGENIQLEVSNGSFPTDNPLSSGYSLNVPIGTDGFARAKVMQNYPGAATVTARSGQLSKTITIQFDNSGNGRFLRTFSPAQNGSATPAVSVGVSGRRNDGVPNVPVHLALSGPATFGDGSKSTDVVTGSNGSVLAPVLATGEGMITLTADATGQHFADPAGSPIAGDKAGVGHYVITFSSAEITGQSSAPAATKAALTFSRTSAEVGVGVLVKAQVQGDQYSVPGLSTQLSFTRAGSSTPAAVSTKTLSDSNGFVVWAFTSNEPGPVTIHVTVFDPTARELPIINASTVTFTAKSLNAAPKLSQRNAGGVVTLTLSTSPDYRNKTVYFFRKSGLTGQVVPLGTGTVAPNGDAKRTFNAKRGQILALYGKVIGATNIATPYSNTITFKVT